MSNEKHNKSVSILSIAERVGVSKTTVGYVLSGQAKSRRVAQKTAERVLEAAREMNYVPHLWARNLARQSTGVVGVILGGYEYNWAAEFFSGATPVLEDQDYIPMTSVHMWQPQRNEAELQLALQRRDEGVICQPLPPCADAYRQFMEAGVPLLFVSDTLEAMPEASYVAWDCAPAAARAVQHLIETGRRRIGFIGSSLVQTQLVLTRYRTYEQTVRDAGLTFDSRWVRWSPLGGLVRRYSTLRNGSARTSADDDALTELLRSLLESKPAPDALFFPHDSLALAVFRVLLKMGVRIPDDVALMGMGDVPLADDFGVGLSTIREPLEEIGRVAAQTILRLVSSSRRKPVHHLVTGNDLKIRRTTRS